MAEKNGNRNTDRVEFRVLILNEDGAWFATGLDLDYCVQGSSLEDVQLRFERGLFATLRAYHERDGNINNIFRTPDGTTLELYEAQTHKWALIFKKKVSTEDLMESLDEANAELVPA